MIGYNRGNGRLPAESQSGDMLSFGSLFRMMRRHRWLFAGILLACVGAAAIITLLTRPLYSSEVFLRIEDKDSRDNLLGNLPSLPGMKESEIETEMLVLRSRELAETVVDSLALRVVLQEPNRPRDQLVRVHSAGRSGMEAEIELRRTGTPGEYRLEILTGGPAGEVRDRVRIGEPFTVGDVQMSLMPAVAADDRLVVEIQPYREAVRALRKKLQVARPEQKAKIVKLTYSANDSLLAADVPNALAGAFIQYKRYTTHSEERSTVEFLKGQVTGYQVQLSEAEEQLRRFREQRQVVSLSDQATEQVKQLAGYQAELNARIQERDGLARILARVEQSATDASTTSPFRQIAAFPSFFTNAAVQDMLSQLNELENERAKVALGRTSSNTDVQSFDRRISEVETQLHQLTRSYVRNLESQITDLRALLARFGGRLDQVPAVEMEFARLAREQKLLEEIYTLLLTRLKEAEVTAAVEPGDVRIIDSALVPDEPVAPRPFRNMLLGTLIGLVLATSTVYVRENSDTAVRSRDDVQARVGDVPVVGYIPHMQATNGTNRLTRMLPGRRAAPSDRTLLAAMLQDGPALEAYRSLRTNLQFLTATGSSSVLLVTSSIPAEGKSTTSTNLAMTLAREGRRILLVDADLRRGHVHTGLGLPRAPGLAQVLLGETPLAQARQPITGADETKLDVLTAGAYPPNAAELLASPRMKELMEQARAEYDTVILDAPPIAAVTDAAILSRYSDTTLLVVRSGHTPRAALEHTVSQLLHVGAPLRGVVINDIDRGKDAGYYAYSYYDYEAIG